MYKVLFPNPGSDRYSEMIHWSYDTIGIGNFMWMGISLDLHKDTEWFFHSEESAFLFILRWGGTMEKQK